ncbi:MAG: hypothetical protein ABI900_09225 [Betaproteobacteria bacterium]
MRISTLIAAVTRLLTGALALLAAPCALALSLGDAVPQSSLGQPLRVIVPIGAGASESLTAACVHVSADAAGGNGPPRLLTGRVTIDRSAAGPQVLVTTRRPVDDPIVRLAVQAGCEGTTRRDYVLLLDPPAAGSATAVIARRVPDAMPAATALLPRETNAKARAATYAAAVAPSIVSRVAAPEPAAAEAPPPPPILLSSPSGSSFMAEASAAGLPRAASAQSALSPVETEPAVAPWWPLAAALLIVAALARWLVPMRRRSVMQPPAWVTPTARTEPNPSVFAGSRPRTIGNAGHFAAMTEPGPGFPRGASKAERTAPKVEPTATRPQPAAAKSVSPVEDPRFAEFDADLVEEQTIRAEWAKAVNDGAIDIGGDSILKAIDDAEREIHGGPVHPAQVALDRSLDDELVPGKSRR